VRGRIPDDVIEQIRQRISIVEIVSAYVTLKKTGRNYSGLCPFHAEKSPSFTVNEERGLFHCFGCGAGGTVFTFLMRADRLEFREAVERLAQRAGMELPKERMAATDPRQTLIAANQAAQEYFAAALRSARGSVARQYLDSRGLSPTIIEQYGLGFCPPEGGLVRALSSRRIEVQPAIQVGLLGRRQDGSFYDRFWGRITFPIRDAGGRVIGFGGRALGDQKPKYLNSPESPLFRKGEGLYGLYEARQSIRAEERVVIVEGYIDALALAQAGISYVVATLGTALTATQLRLARRFAPQVVAFFDGDAAGQKAAVRAFAVCAETNVWGLGAFLPEGFDPDTYVRQLGTTATLTLITHAVPLAEFFLQSADPGPAATVPQKMKAAATIAQVLSKIQDATQFSILAHKAAQMLGVGEDVFRHRRQPDAVQAVQQPLDESAPNESYRPEELTLAEAMALDRQVAEFVENNRTLSRFASPELSAAARRIVDSWGSGQSIEGILDTLPSVLSRHIRAGLLGEGPVANGNRMEIARDCIERIVERDRRTQLQALRTQVQQAEASGRSAPLEILRDHLRRRSEPPTA